MTAADSTSTRPRTGHGVDDSIVGRIHDVGGRSEIVSAPGTGTEVRLWST